MEQEPKIEQVKQQGSELENEKTEDELKALAHIHWFYNSYRKTWGDQETARRTEKSLLDEMVVKDMIPDDPLYKKDVVTSEAIEKFKKLTNQEITEMKTEKEQREWLMANFGIEFEYLAYIYGYGNSREVVKYRLGDLPSETQKFERTRADVTVRLSGSSLGDKFIKDFPEGGAMVPSLEGLPKFLLQSSSIKKLTFEEIKLKK